MSYIQSQFNKDDWLKKVYQKSESEGSVNVAKLAIVNLEYFCQFAFKRNADIVIEDLKHEKEEKTYIFLSNFVEFMAEDHPKINIRQHKNTRKTRHLKKKNPATIRGYFAFVRSYMRSRGLKTHLEDVKEWVSLPTRLKYEPKPLTEAELRLIVNSSSSDRKALYLTLIGSGMRIGEAVQLRKKDIDLGINPIEIKIPAGITKTKTARTTYLSSEAKPWVLPILMKISDNDLVFGKNENRLNAVLDEMRYFERIRRKLGLLDRYESNRHKVTVHSMRAYTATKAAKIHDDNYAHGLIGHSRYLGQYIRLSREELAEMYKELEPELFIFDTTKRDHEINLLKTQKLEFDKRDKDFEELKTRYEQMAIDLEKLKKRQELTERLEIRR